MDRTLFSVTVTETTKNRGYWASQSWAEKSTEQIRRADLLVVPWENFRNEFPVLFPQGTTDFFKELSAALEGQQTVAMAIDRELFNEVALHADERRLPTLFMSFIAVPIVINILSNHVDKWLFEGVPTPTVEMSVIVEGPQGKCISVKYKGPSTELVKTVEEQVRKCFPQAVENGTGKHAKPKHVSKPPKRAK